MKKWRKLTSVRIWIIISVAVILGTLMVNPLYAADNVDTVRPSVNGNLHVEGADLKDEAGRPAELRGVSTHGLTWYPGVIDEDIFKALSSDWNCNFIRLAMYSDIYSSGKKEKENL